jgi:hypothetical protein
VRQIFINNREYSIFYNQNVYNISIVKTSSHEYQAIEYRDLSKKDQKENDWCEDSETQFIVYRDWAYPLGNFMRLEFLGREWDGVAHHSYSNGIVVKVLENGNFRMGYYYGVTSITRDKLEKEKGCVFDLTDQSSGSNFLEKIKKFSSAAKFLAAEELNKANKGENK